MHYYYFSTVEMFQFRNHKDFRRNYWMYQILLRKKAVRSMCNTLCNYFNEKYISNTNIFVKA